jgi:hypothetical protein
MVDTKCMNGHTFDVTSKMIGVTKSGSSFKATCPVCGAPAQLTHKKVIDLMGLKDNNEARALKAKMVSELRGSSGNAEEEAESEPAAAPPRGTMRPTGIIEEERDEDEQVDAQDDSVGIYGETSLADALTRGGLPSSMMQEIAAVERQIRGQQGYSTPPAPAPRQRKRPQIDVMGPAATARSKNDVLRDTVDATNLPDTVKQKVIRFVGLKPDGLSPHELYSVLTYLGVGNAPALAVVRAYEFDLSMQQQEMDQERQIFNMLGVPLPDNGRVTGGDFPGMGSPFASQGPTPQMGGNGAPNPFLTPPPRASGGVGGAQMPNGSSGGKTDPQIDVMSLLPLMGQYPQAFQILMGNPVLMQAVAQNPAMLFQIIQMTGGARAQDAMPSQPAGISREEVRAIVGAEMGEIKKMLTDVACCRKEDAIIEAMRENQKFIFEFMKGQIAQSAAPSKRDDPVVQQQTQIVSALLNNLLERQNQDGTGVILQALDELKKNQTGVGSGSQSIEGMNLFLRYQELTNQMEETRSRFQDEKEKRESLKDIVTTAAETIGDTIAGVIQQGIGGSGGLPGSSPAGIPAPRPATTGRMRPPRDRPAVDPGDDEVVMPDRAAAPAAPGDEEPAPAPAVAEPAGVTTLQCLKCGTPIYVPVDASKAECPACHEKFRIDRPPESHVPTPPSMEKKRKGKGKAEGVSSAPAPSPESIGEPTPSVVA